ncbi:MAG TPA: GYF domain-containing protein [Bauldia sp.]|nr:GYF domain-containing protein [Bauldia sp.]
MRLHRFGWVVAALVAAALTAGSVEAQVAREEPATGLIFTPADQLRGIPLASSPYSGAELPSSVDLSDRMPPPGDQGHQQSCVGWAIAYALKSYQENLELRWGYQNPEHLFSPAYIYNQINNGVDGGSQFVDALNLLSSQGVAPLSAMPYTPADFRAQPSPEARNAARPYRIDTWRQVNIYDTREVKAQLNAGYPVIIGVVVDDALINLQRGQIWNSPGSPPRGGHAMLVVGYDDARNAFKVINSWGQGWADGGYGWIDYTYFRSVVREGYVAKDASDSASPAEVPVAVNPPTTPPAVATGVTFSVTGVQHNVNNLGVIGMVFTGVVDVPADTRGQLQVVIRVASAPPGGGAGAVGPPVHSVNPAYATPNGEAATGTPAMPLQGQAVHTTWYAFLPYATLQIPRNTRNDLVALPTIYLNQFGVRDGVAIPFFVVLPDETTKYYIGDNGKAVGPLDFADLAERVSKGTVTGDTYVWKNGTPNWILAKDDPGLASILAIPREDTIPTVTPGSAAAADTTRFMLGKWQLSGQGPPGTVAPATFTIDFGADGNITGDYAYTPAGYSTPISAPIVGVWTAEPAGDKRIKLSMRIRVQSQTSTQMPESYTTTVMEVIDGDTLRDLADGTLTKRVKTSS